ncbi:hypothetical protein M0R45_006842 [Rubus argutus]|uniref:F-box protein n=1 Tax=Rubus argutus TaxID=59490 RepID=A0AAW1YSF2_RUBAR
MSKGKGEEAIIQRREKFSWSIDPNAYSRSLFLCLAEYEDYGMVSYSILSVKLRDLFSYAGYFQKPQLQLQQVRKFSGNNLPFFLGCGVWRSNILLGGGTEPRYDHGPYANQPVMGYFHHHPARQIYCFDKHTNEFPLKEMLRGNVQPLLVELDDKLYALGKSVTGASFEVFDPNDNEWSSLPYPRVDCLSYPFAIRDRWAIYDQYFAVAGRRILVSDGIASYWFDTADPKQGWRGLDEFPFMGSTVVVDDGEQFVLFVFKPSDFDVPHISVHLISYDFEYIKRDYSHVSLPLDFPKCCPGYLGDLPLSNHTLVHVGDKIVCLLVSSEQKWTFMCVAFQFIVNGGDEALPPLIIKFLPRSVLVDECIDMDMASSAGQMLGAFLL